VTNPTNTVYATKRLIGRGFKDEQTQKEMKVWPAHQIAEIMQRVAHRWIQLGCSSGWCATVVEMQQWLVRSQQWLFCSRGRVVQQQG
jgi:hypothetical protein